MLPERLQFKGASIGRMGYSWAALSGPVWSRRCCCCCFVFSHKQILVPRRVCLLWGTSYFLTLTVTSAGI